MHGYYLISLVSTEDLDTYDDRVLDYVFQALDDCPWPPPDRRPSDQRYGDYEVSESDACTRLVNALVGGGSIGHTRETMSRAAAVQYWNRFRALFSGPVRFFAGLGLGRPEFVFQESIAIVGLARAGVLASSRTTEQGAA
jgi:hypothetical protein